MIDNATIATSTRNMFKDGSTKSSHRITISRVGDYLTSALAPITTLVANTNLTLDLIVGQTIL